MFNDEENLTKLCNEFHNETPLIVIKKFFLHVQYFNAIIKMWLKYCIIKTVQGFCSMDMAFPVNYCYTFRHFFCHPKV